MSDPAVALQLHQTMVLIRGVETRIERLHKEGRLRGSFHSSIGSEGASAGVGAALRDGDLVTSTHRGHGHAIAVGVPIEQIFAELFGRSTGTSRGRGGSMHLHHRPSGFLGQNAIVAGSMPWAAGAAWAARRQGLDLIGVGFLGDGAMAQGLAYETLRLAVLWESPCLFVCENNGLAHSMATERLFGKPGGIADFANSLGLRSEHADGRDAVGVHETASDLVEEARQGRPAFLEISVGRVTGHSVADPDYRYRDKEAGRDWLRENDPISVSRSQIGVRYQAELDAIDEDVDSLIKEAVAAAEAAPEPDLSEALFNVVSRSAGMVDTDNG